MENPAKTLLHIGCGDRKGDVPEIFASWHEATLEIDPAFAPDIVADMRDLSKLSAESFDGVFSSHSLEHINTHEVPATLAGFRRVMKTDGVLCLRLPDLQSAVEAIAAREPNKVLYTSPGGAVRPLDILYGHAATTAGGNGFMVHKTGFTKDSLGNILWGVGFRDIQITRIACELHAVAHKRPDDYEDCGIIKIYDRMKNPHLQPA